MLRSTKRVEPTELRIWGIALSSVSCGDKDSPNRRVRIDGALTVRDLAQVLGMRDVELIKALFDKKIMRTVGQIVEVDLARQLAVDLGFELID